MKIALQRLKDGDVTTFDLPAPKCGKGEVLVQTHYSVISSGTELSRLMAAKSSLLGKALQRPEEFKKVLTAVKRKGLSTTFTKVSNRLEQYNKIGYSSSGVVIEKHGSVRHVDVGDKVALAGSGFAIHSEYTIVPANLCVKLPEALSLRSGAYATIGSIALQGVRQMEPQIGETIVVIGLGLLGQIAVSLLQANGIRVVGIDPVEERRSAANADYSCSPSDAGVNDLVRGITNGYGADGILITASTKSTDPINMAGSLARKRGRVIIVGDIGHDFERSNYYEKELTIRMSCSYGAGRYDKLYEESGIDYPQAYVPWTIARNMESFMWLVSKERVNVEKLVSHEFSIEDAPLAYQKLLENAPDTFSILFGYEHSGDEKVTTEMLYEVPEKRAGGKSIGIVGIGNYAKSFIVPSLDKRLSIDAISAKSPSSLIVKSIDKCRLKTTDPDEVISDPDIQTIIVATRHSTHGQYVIGALENGKNVYVEKPAVINREQLAAMLAALSNKGGNICVGFNRRYAGAIKAIEANIEGLPIESRYTVVADDFSEDYWALKDEEGGIIVGEVIHFVDLLSQLHKSRVIRVCARANLRAINKGTYHITLYFENDSIGEITYLMGNEMGGDKERIELLYNDDRVVIEGFKQVISNRKKQLYKSRKMDMGRETLFGDMMYRFADGEAVQDLKGLVSSHLAVFAIRESILSGSEVSVEQVS